MSVQFLVHEDGDSVGVITVEGVKVGQELTGWIMKEDKTITFKVLDDIPIGHKIALKDLNVGDTVFKYGTDIGKVVKPIRQGLSIFMSTTSRPKGGRSHAKVIFRLSPRQRPRGHSQSCADFAPGRPFPARLQRRCQ